MKQLEKILSVAHFMVLLLLIGWNYYSNTGVIDGKTVGSISDRYDNLFTPAGYAFAIWGIIYLGLLVLGVYMVYRAFSKTKSAEFVRKAAPTLTLAHLGNGTWLWFWLNEESGTSVVVMVFILSMLIWTILRLNMQRWNAPLSIIVAVWWPISLYSGWISVATIANFSAHLGHLGWNGGISEVTWAVTMISVATAVNLFMIVTRKMRLYGAVGIWALVAIAVRHWDSMPILKWTALAGAILIALAAAVQAYQNRATLPFVGSQPSD